MNAEIAALKQQYGDFDGQTLVKYAVDHQIGDLGAAYRAMRFDDVWASSEEAKARSAADAAAAAAKGAAPPIAGGAGRNAGAIVTGGTNPKPTLEEAFHLARAELAAQG